MCCVEEKVVWEGGRRTFLWFNSHTNDVKGKCILETNEISEFWPNFLRVNVISSRVSPRNDYYAAGLECNMIQLRRVILKKIFPPWYHFNEALLFFPFLNHVSMQNKFINEIIYKIKYALLHCKFFNSSMHEQFHCLVFSSNQNDISIEQQFLFFISNNKFLTIFEAFFKFFVL